MGGQKSAEAQRAQSLREYGRPQNYRGLLCVGGQKGVGGPMSVEAKDWQARALRPKRCGRSNKCRGRKGVGGQASVEAQQVEAEKVWGPTRCRG